MIAFTLSEIGLTLLLIAPSPVPAGAVPPAPIAVAPLARAFATAPAATPDRDGYQLIEAIQETFHHGAEICDGGDGPEGLVLGIHRMPVVAIRADEDDGEPGHGVEFWADMRTSHGQALELGYRKGPLGLGLLYITSEHLDDFTRIPGRMHGAYLETKFHGEFPLGSALTSLTVAAGLGAAGIDFEEFYDDTGGTALELRAALGVRGRHLGVELGGGFFEWGEPGETVGKGSFLTAGITWHP